MNQINIQQLNPANLPGPYLVFAGPSLSADISAELNSDLIDIRPPVKRHDIDQLTEEGFKGTIFIADGWFRQELAVGHIEIRTALKEGIKVFGLSAMGAIRALEMESLGVQGIGKVFNSIKKEPDFRDDEILCLHSDAPSFSYISEPLIHFREYVEDKVDKKQVAPTIGRQIIDQLASDYFGDRTMDRFLQLIVERTELRAAEVLNEFDEYRVTQQDLTALINILS